MGRSSRAGRRLFGATAWSWTGLLAGVIAMLAVTLPVLLLGFYARQQVGVLVHVDSVAVSAASGFTRRHSLAVPLRAIQWLTRPVHVYLLASAVLAWAGLGRGLRGRALWGFVTMMTGWGIGSVAKAAVQRVRPVLDDPVAHAGGFSFPSGHALNITVATSVLLVALWPLLSSRALRVGAVTATAVVVAIVGCDRVLLGVHFPSDVVGGVVLGLGITFSSWVAFSGRTSGTSSSASWLPDSRSGR